MKIFRRILTGFGLIVTLALPSVALAANPSDGDVLGVSGGSGAAGTDGGALPFTGLNLVLIIAIALGLIVLGVVLRRRSAHQS
jgi:hypothetical protein